MATTQERMVQERTYTFELCDAIWDNDVESLKNLLAQRANPDTCYGDEYSSNLKFVLFLAYRKGYTECVKALLDAGAKPDIHDKRGQTPVSYCLSLNFLDTANVLLDHAGDKASEIVNYNEGGAYRTCLNVMASRGCIEGIKLLLRYGADVNGIDCHGMTPLMSCLGNPNYRPKQKTSLPAVKLLVEAGADLEMKDQNENTALQIAAMEFALEAVEYLLSMGADVNSEDFQGKTAVTNALYMHSMYKGYKSGDNEMAVMVMLIQSGANLNCMTREGNVLMACLRDPSLSARFIRLFLSKGADPDICVGGDRPLLRAIKEKDLNGTCALLEFNASLKTHDSVGSTASEAMDVAVIRRLPEFACILLLAGDETWRDRSKSEKVWQMAEEEYDKKIVDDAVIDCLRQRLSVPPLLSELSIYKLRSTMGTHLHKAVPLLPVPCKVKDAILLKDILTYQPKGFLSQISYKI